MNFAPLLVMISSGVAAIMIVGLAIEDGMQGLAWHRECNLRRARASLTEVMLFLDAELLYIAAALCGFVIVLSTWLLTRHIACGVVCGALWDVLAATGLYALHKRRRCIP